MIGFEVIDKELVELVLTVGKDQTGPVVFYIFNNLELVFNLGLVDSLILYLLLKLSYDLLVFTHLILILVLLVKDLGELLLCLLLVTLALLATLKYKHTCPP
jgi:hypothetical protein